MNNKPKKSLSNKNYSVRKYDAGWIAVRKADKLQVYFEDYNELLDFINS